MVSSARQLKAKIPYTLELGWSVNFTYGKFAPESVVHAVRNKLIPHGPVELVPTSFEQKKPFVAQNLTQLVIRSLPAAPAFCPWAFRVVTQLCG